MRALPALAATLFLITGAAHAQESTEQVDKAHQAKDPKADCATMLGTERGRCLNEVRLAQKAAAAGTNGLKAKDAKLVNDTNAAAQAKAVAGDLTGSVVVYDTAIKQAADSPVRHHLYAGLAIALRRQAVAAYNSGPQPNYPVPGASNDVIRAANAANAALLTQRVAAAMPLFRRALDAAVQAATLADASKDKSADAVIGVELREDAGLLYRLDSAAVFAAPRAGIDTEVAWFTRWFDATSPLAEALAAKHGFALAAGLTAKDKAAGVALADKVRARTGGDIDGLLGYADVIVAAKVPAGDPRRAKALAELSAAEPTVADSQQRAKLTRLKTALAAS